MAPKFSAPKVWRRPYTSIYNDNYRYGNSLYEGAISDIERKYNDALSRATFASDRPDINYFGDSSAISQTRASLERSLSASRRHQLQHSHSYDAYSSSKALADMKADLAEQESKLRRSRSRSTRRRPESAYGTISAFEDALLNDNPDGHSQAFWMERCRELQREMDNLNQQLTDANGMIKQETVGVKSKLNQELGELFVAVDDQERKISELHKIVKKQMKQIADLSQELEGTQRHYLSAADTVSMAQKRCQNLVHEVDEMRSTMDKVDSASSAEKHCF